MYEYINVTYQTDAVRSLRHHRHCCCWCSRISAWTSAWRPACVWWCAAWVCPIPRKPWKKHETAEFNYEYVLSIIYSCGYTRTKYVRLCSESLWDGRGEKKRKWGRLVNYSKNGGLYGGVCARFQFTICKRIIAAISYNRFLINLRTWQ